MSTEAASSGVGAGAPEREGSYSARRAPGEGLSQEGASAEHANRRNRWPITVCIMIATTMVFLDQTIANVALPHIQGSVSASQDQITWVLTSYIVASALMLPLSGWLAARIGVRTLLLGSVAIFTLTSALCGLSANLPEIVFFRILQGASGASLMPISQSIIFDIHPPEARTQAMALWGMGTLAAPMAGPVLGGWLTQYASWRWVFFVNVPVGVLCFLGIATFLAQGARGKSRPFDGVGFAFLVCFIGGLQLMLDRGQSVGWFEANEIWIELIVGGLGLYLFLIHALSAKHPFFHPSLMSNMTLLTTSLVGSIITAVLMSSTALQPLMVQRLLGYSVLQAGLIAAPRGIGMLFGMQAANYFLPRLGARKLMAIGMAISGTALLMMSGFSLQMDAGPIILTGIISGCGGPLVFVPVSMMALNNLDPTLRTEGATMYNLFRNLGSSLGIAVVSALQVRSAALAHARLVEHIRPDNPLVGAYMPRTFSTPSAMGMVDAMAGRQAEMISYVQVFALLGLLSLATMPLVLIMKSTALPARVRASEAHMD